MDGVSMSDVAGAQEPILEPSPVSLINHKGVRQFVKFCIVGASSFAINAVALKLLYYNAHFAYIPAMMMSFLIAVVNGFVFNRAWTFKDQRGNSAGEQLGLFVAVNVVGLVLNTLISAAVMFALLQTMDHATAQFSQVCHDMLFKTKGSYPPLQVFIALVGATAVVVFWNFFANKKWTFKK
jgi:putative flippase GtrA